MNPLLAMISELENEAATFFGKREEKTVQTISLERWTHADTDQRRELFSSGLVGDENPEDARRMRDRHRKRNMSDEQKDRVREQALLRRATMTEEDLIKRRTQDRERKRLKCLDAEYRKDLYGMWS